MRTVSLVLSTLAIASVATAQNRMLRNNEPYLVISGASNPVTLNAYNYPPVNVNEFATGSGLVTLAGQRAWRTFDPNLSVRFDTWQHTGYTGVHRQAAANTTATAYWTEPQVGMCGLVARSGGGWDPNFSAPISVTTSVLPSPLTGIIARISVTFAASPVNFDTAGNIGGFAMWGAYLPGGNDDIASDPVTLFSSQCFCSSWQDGPVLGAGFPAAYVPDGFTDSTGTTLVAKTTDQFRLWMNPVFSNPTLNIYSDYGQRRIAPLAPPILGHSDGSYYADLGSAATSTIGFTVRGGPNFGSSTALLYMNVQPTPWNLPFPITDPFNALNTLTFDISLFDGFFFALSSVQLPLDAAGNVDSGTAGFQLILPPLPGLIGSYLGFESVLFNQTTLLLDTSDGVWVYVAI